MEFAGPLETPLGMAQWKRASPRGEAETSGFLSVSDSDRRVTAELGQESQATSFLRNGTPLAFRVVHGVTGHLLSCVWNLRVFPDDAQGVSVPLRIVPSSTGLPSKRCPGIGFFSRACQKIGVFQHVVPPTRLCLEFSGTLLKRTRCPDTSLKATLWMKAQHEGALTPLVHRLEKPAGSTHSLTRGLKPHEQLARQAEFHSSEKT